MSRLRSKYEIDNYEEKAKVIQENGWENWYHDDNWIKPEWIEQGLRYEYMGRSTEDVYRNIIKQKDL